MESHAAAVAVPARELPAGELRRLSYLSLFWLAARECLRVGRLWSQTVLAPVVSSLLFVIVFGRLIWLRHARYGTFDFDLGHHDQAIWLLSQGKGFITVSGEKMSKSRGTGISPLQYLELGMDAEWLRYYLAAKMNSRVEDVDFTKSDFAQRVNSDLIGKYVNIASRAAGFIFKKFEGRVDDSALAAMCSACEKSSRPPPSTSTSR